MPEQVRYSSTKQLLVPRTNATSALCECSNATFKSLSAMYSSKFIMESRSSVLQSSQDRPVLCEGRPWLTGKSRRYSRLQFEQY